MSTDPTIRFLHPPTNQQGDEGGQNADQKQRAPSVIVQQQIERGCQKKPAAQADCKMPAAFALLSSGHVSATIAAPAAHSPPMPSAVRNR